MEASNTVSKAQFWRIYRAIAEAWTESEPEWLAEAYQWAADPKEQA